MSIGVACFPADGDSPNELLHQADIAVYCAKLNGRNCVVCISEVPPSVKIEGLKPVEDRLATPFTPTFVPRPDSLSRKGRLSTGVLNTGPLRTGPLNTGPLSFDTGSLNTGKLVASQAHDPAEAFHNAPTAVSGAAHSPTLHMPALPSLNNKPTGILAPLELSESANHEGASTDTLAEGQPAVHASALAKIKRPSWLLSWYMGLVILSGVLITVFGFLYGGNSSWDAVALLTLLAVCAEVLRINVYEANTVSVSVALAFAAALIGGIPGAACASAAIAVVHYVQGRPKWYKTPFNWATHVLSGSAPAFTISLLGLSLSIGNLPLVAIPIALAAVAYYVIDTALIAVAISFAQGLKVSRTWHEQFRWLMNHYVALCIMGLFLSTAYASMGLLGVLVFTLPVFMMRYSQKQYVERTEENVNELRHMNEQLTWANAEVVAASKAMQESMKSCSLPYQRSSTLAIPTSAGTLPRYPTMP